MRSGSDVLTQGTGGGMAADPVLPEKLLAAQED